VASFLGAFLLFQIQPLMSKVLLPAFGGSYLVWGACMVFFQFMLLLGYAYAHAIQTWLGVARYSRLHLLILVLPLFFFPAQLGGVGDAGATGAFLSLQVFAILLKAVGLPFLVLSTTSLVLQRWLLASNCPERNNPYVLYSASNLGSMLALLTYPVVVEPFLALDRQGDVWWIGYALLVLLQAACLPAPSARRNEPAAPSATAPLPVARLMEWFLPSAAGCAILLAATNVITLDIASVPLLWVLPLSVYLLSFVLAFKRKLFYPPWLRALFPWALLLGVLLHLLAQLHLSAPAWLSITLHLLILFCVCMSCSARLVEAKPEDPRHLTLFYLVLAFGGFAGSVVVSWVFPLVTTSLLEYPASLALAAAALAYREMKPARADGPDRPAETVFCLAVTAATLTLVPWLAARYGTASAYRDSLLLVIVAVPVALCLRRLATRPWPLAALLLAAALAMNWTEGLAMGGRQVARLRNFYGIYRVFDKDGMRCLEHGSTLHGRQYLRGPKANMPLSYYHPSTPAALILQWPDFTFKNIDMIGLGTGALAAYAGAGQQFTIRELDPDNLPIAEKYFTYLALARQHGAEVVFVPGDGRITLRQAPAGSVDLLIVDAFNSGSIPVHLLTVEAFEEYFRALAPDGLLLLHVSNKFLDLAPVIYANAKRLGIDVYEASNDSLKHADADVTHWMALSRSRGVVRVISSHLGWWQQSWPPYTQPWTDRYCNILGALMCR